MGSMAPDFLRGGRGAASSPITGGTMAAAPASGGAVTQLRSELGDAMTGRISLLMLNTLVLALVLFYLWTRSAQGGG